MSGKASRSKGKRFYVKKKSYASGHGVDGSLRRHMLTVGNTYVKRSGELKALDYYKIYTPVVDDEIDCLNAIKLGSDFYNRVGREVYNNSIRLMYSVYPTATDITNLATRPYFVRVALVWDTQCFSAIPLFSDIFSNVLPTGSEVTDINASINLSNKRRFLVLRDVRFETPTMQTVVAGGGSVRRVDAVPTARNGKCLFDWYIKLKNIKTIYNAGDNGDVRDINTGALYLVQYLRLGTMTERPWDSKIISRLRYYDS